ncbi:MAG: hypothetical protein HZA66_23025 [Rhodopseudomonas palustris]|uniref:Uncharacterized protein n=1 Tax=Rhodopseudomonas palustris TaxID=1076 RepID=A0A933S0V3_RHOPL|nr:hypothetical protein [Rhodopseudomonas palustris]
MFRGLFVAVLSVLLLDPSIGSAAESSVTSAKGFACKQTRFPPDYANEQSEWRCPGPPGFSLGYFDHITRGGLTLEHGGHGLTDDSLTWRPADPAIGSHVEWRVENGTPFAAIFGRWRSIEQDGPSADVTVEELLVVKVSPRQVCAVAVIGGLSAQAMTLAREQADSRARAFRCGVDQPFINTSSSSDAVASLDGRVLNREVLDHNGSTVELVRSRSGTVEIRYTMPKPSLSIPAGTMLFRGSERNGRISGQAFVFKTGCAPAGYEVSGARQGGYLVLEGAAPRRGAGCSLAGMSKKSGHARLLFERDPVLQAAATETVAPPPPSSQALPLQRGYYVRSDTACRRASNATLSLFNGQSLGSAHVECKPPTIQMISENHYRIADICRTTQVENGAWEAINTTIEIKSRTEFVSTTPAGEFHYRYCVQSDLPTPWSAVDISALSDLGGSRSIP